MGQFTQADPFLTEPDGQLRMHCPLVRTWPEGQLKHSYDCEP